MKTQKNKCLIAGAIGSGTAALAHVGCIVFGGDWYRFFGAGERMAQMAEAGLWFPSLVTSFLVIVLMIWSLYGLSGSRLIMRLPLLRLVLILISAIYSLRGLGFMFLMPHFPGNGPVFWLVSSSICFVIGSLYAIGTFQQWNELGTQQKNQ